MANNKKYINYFLGNSNLIRIINLILSIKNIKKCLLYKVIEESLEIIYREECTKNILVNININRFNGNIFFL